MPRPKVPDSARRRVAQACIRCQRRKEKCNGERPCSLCKRRGVVSECIFIEGSSRSKPIHADRTIQLRDDMPDNSDAEIAIESLLNLSGHSKRQRTQSRNEPDDEVASQAPVPKLARLLRDGKGKFMYIGDSATLSFLQNIRRLVNSSIGRCSFTTDSLRHHMVESTPSGQASWMTSQEISADLRPSVDEARAFFRHYLVATSGILDLFDSEDLMRNLPIWLENPSKAQEFTSSIYYLVLAIGAQVSPESTTDTLAERYFNHGRYLTASSFMDDPSVLTIQSYALITMYMVGACRRNGAFMNLGIAVRAAHALGLHRSDTSLLFYSRERKTRERVWKTIRVLDLFLSASLGRPPATSDMENDAMSWNKKSTPEVESLPAQSFSAIVSICFIFERILVEVYGKRVITTNQAQSISQQHREWTSAIPNGLNIDAMQTRDNETNEDLRQVLGLCHLNGAYYWSIILLTRPFFAFRVTSHVKHKESSLNGSTDSNTYSSLISTFADACVDSAVRNMEVSYELIQHPNIPKALPFVVNSIFVSALVCGVAHFGDFDRSFPLQRSMDQAEACLRHFGRHDRSAKRYLQIVGYLREAVEIYVVRRDRRVMENRRKLVSHMFGEVLSGQAPPDVRPATSYSNDVEGMHEQSTAYQSTSPAEQYNAPRYENPNKANGTNTQWYPQPATDTASSQGPSITTSGYLAEPMTQAQQPLPQTQSQFPDQQVFNMLPPFADPAISQVSPGSSSLPSYAEDIPLFTLLNDFDPMMNGEFMLDAG